MFLSHFSSDDGYEITFEKSNAYQYSSRCQVNKATLHYSTWSPSVKRIPFGAKDHFAEIF